MTRRRDGDDVIEVLLALGLALADEPPAVAVEPPDPPPAEAPAPPADADVTAVEPEPVLRPRRPYRIGGLVLPLFDYNSTDGAGLGLGVELYDRRREAEHGYRNRVSGWTYWTTLGTYTSNYVQYEHRGRIFLVARLVYREWRDMIYVGAGGADVALARPDTTTRGNRVVGPTALVSAIVPIPRSPVQVWMQLHARYTYAEAAPDGVLFERQPYGLGDVFQIDTAVGVSVQETDRWPMPNKGVRAEASARFGGTLGPQGLLPLAGVNVEAMGWWPLVGQHLVIGGRVLLDKTWGERPFWDQEFVGGQFRDEMGDEQMFTGYARSRTRGDGVLAGVLELRPKFAQIRHRVFDIGFYGSVYGEVGWLFRGNDPGPILPTVGVGPSLLWQGAVEFRPFVAWGWLSDVPGGPRTAQSVFGIAIASPL